MTPEPSFYHTIKTLWLQALLSKIFIRKMLCLKFEKRSWFVIKYVILKQTPIIMKTFLWNAAKMGYQYIFACKQKNIFVEWMSGDSIFMVNVEKYFLRSRWKRLPKTCLHCLFFMYTSVEDEKKAKIYSLCRF